jgi:sulfatase maturation enzyme AslB (radical SAM superfamily)
LKASEAPKYISSKRPVAELLDLDWPLGIFIEPTNVCNFRCTICPESFEDYQETTGYYQRMSWATWQVIAQNLSVFVPNVLRFYFLGEPLLNPDLPNMIRQAVDEKLAKRTELTTNGSLLTAKTARKLVASGLDYLKVSVYGTTNEEYRAASGSKYDSDTILANVKQLRRIRDELGSKTPRLVALYVNDATTEQRDRFFAQYDDVVDECGLDALHNWGTEELIQLGRQRLNNRVVCKHPFINLSIRSTGIVSVCCADWGNDLNIGDLRTETLYDIWHGEKLRRIRELHLTGHRDVLPICARCSVISKQVDDLDSLIIPEPRPVVGRTARGDLVW